MTVPNAQETTALLQATGKDAETSSVVDKLSQESNVHDVVDIKFTIKLDEPPPVWQDELRKQLALVGPISVTYVLEFLPGFVSVILCGHLKGGDPKLLVDAAALSTLFMNISATSIGYGLCTALDTLCSQAYGAKEYTKMGIYMQSGMIVFAVCLVPLIMMNWHAEQGLIWLGQDPEIARLAGEFSRITVFGLPFLFMYELIRNLLQASHEIRPLMLNAALNTIVNIVAGYYLSYHTSLGFYGVALAKTLGNMIMLLGYVPYFYITKSYRRWWPGWQFRAAWKQVSLFLRLGISGMLMMAMEWWAFEMVTIFSGLLPNHVVAVSVNAVLLNVESTVYMLANGIAMAGNIRVGNALGAGLPKHAKLTCKLTLIVVWGVAAVLAVLVYCFRYTIPGWLIDDEAAIQYSGYALCFLAPYLIVDVTNCVLQGIFSGIGRQHIAAVSNAIAYYAIGIPISAVLAFIVHAGLVGIWIGLGAGILAALLFCGVMLLRADWNELADDAKARLEQ